MSKQYNTPPALTIEAGKTYSATFETSQGNIECQLFSHDAPNTVNNFVFLSREGFYDGTQFHRVIPNFMVQGGDPTATGTGGPGYQFADEFDGNSNRHGTGTLSMANAGPGTNGSQFFITHAPQPHLDGKHTVFGKVTSGQEVVNSIKQGDTINKLTINES